MKKETITNLANKTRWFRKFHRLIGISASFILLLIACTGLLLAWKKNSQGLLLANTQTGSSTDAANWQSLQQLQSAAIAHLVALHPDADTSIDRMDVRIDKGIVKVSFKHHFKAVQVDLATAAPLLLEVRRADFIEQLHDGSIIDRFTGNNFGKLTYSSIGGLTMLFLTISGFYLWLNPKRIRKHKSSAKTADAFSAHAAQKQGEAPSA